MSVSSQRGHAAEGVRPLAAVIWADPRWRRGLVVGAVALVVVVVAVAAPRLRARLVPSAAPAAGPTATADGAAAQPAPPDAQPPPSGRLAPAPTSPTAAQLAIAALPLLLGLFWLLSAWLVDAEARRAFVVQEPWGERRTLPYSCLAVGCVFPLILAGLIFAAWGFVHFVIYVANRQNWIAGIQAGALIFLVFAVALIVRSLVVRFVSDRRAT